MEDTKYVIPMWAKEVIEDIQPKSDFLLSSDYPLAYDNMVKSVYSDIKPKPDIPLYQLLLDLWDSLPNEPRAPVRYIAGNWYEYIRSPIDDKLDRWSELGHVDYLG